MTRGAYLMEITFLGTGAGIPSKERNVTAIMLNLIPENNHMWLFDCGEATQHQILHTSLKPRKINKIFITHLHGDHLFGLPGLISSRSFLAGDDLLTIYGPIGIKRFVETVLSVSDTHLAYPIKYVEVTESGVIFEDENFIVDTVFLDHGVKSIGYRIKETDKLGELNAQKLKTAGILPGPIYRQIKENEQTVLDDGSIVYRKDFLGEAKKGRVITIFGDTRFVPEHLPFIHQSDVLIHEATFDAHKEALAYKYHHSTTKQAAMMAKEAEVGTLLLTHISSRYQKDEEQMLLEEAKSIFPNTFIATDFFQFDVD